MRKRNASNVRIGTSRFRGRDTAERFPRVKTEDGATLVEFAIGCLVLLAMLFGICEFGTVLYAYHFASHAAKSATRWTAVCGSTCSADPNCACGGPATPGTVLTYVQNMAPSGINTGNLSTPMVCGVAGSSSCADSLPTGCAATPNLPGCTVAITVCYDYKFIFPLMPGGSSTNCKGNPANGTLTLSSTSEMIIMH